MMKKLKTFIEQSNYIHHERYDYSNVLYNGDSIKVTIICPVHGKFNQSPSSHLQGSGCWECGVNKRSKAAMKTTEKFIEEANQKHNNYYDYEYTEYQGTTEQVTIVCPNHGKFTQKAYKHLSGQGCSKCSVENQRMTKSVFVEKALKKHNNKYIYNKTKYTTTRKEIIITCPKHGDFTQVAQNHLRGAGCHLCGFESIRDGNKISKQHFLDKSRLFHKNKYDYSAVEYIDARTKVLIICPDHGGFRQLPTSHYHSGCPKCSKTNLSHAEQVWLNNIGIPDDANHRHVTIKLDEKYLIVDGFDPETNTIYEYYGDFWHGNPNKYQPDEINPISKKSYGELYENTIKREKLLKENGYKLIIQWETDVY